MDQSLIREIAEDSGVILLCGRFEGIDQRVIEAREMEEVSLGDFILSGGEIAALALLDAVVRLLPGVTGNRSSLEEESFEAGLLEYPHCVASEVLDAIPDPGFTESEDEAGERRLLGPSFSDNIGAPLPKFSKQGRRDYAAFLRSQEYHNSYLYRLRQHY